MGKPKQPHGPSPTAPISAGGERGRPRSPSSSTNSDEPVTIRPRTDALTLVVAAQPCEVPPPSENSILKQQITDLTAQNQQLLTIISTLTARVQNLEAKAAAPPSPPTPPISQPFSDSSTAMISVIQQIISLITPLIPTAPAAPPAPPPVPLPQQQPSAPSSYRAAVSPGEPRPPPSTPAPQPVAPPTRRGGPTRGAAWQVMQQLYNTRFVVDAPADAAFLVDPPEDAKHGGDMVAWKWRVQRLFATHLSPRLSKGQEPAAILYATSMKGSSPSAPGSRVRILFSVDEYEASWVVSDRHLLKGTGITIYDVLSPEEQERHDALWPHFLKAQREGKKAQFNRAVLKVDGERVEL